MTSTAEVCATGPTIPITQSCQMDRGMIGCFAQVTHPAKTLDQQVIKQRMDKVKCAHACFRVHFNLSSSDIIAIICMSITTTKRIISLLFVLRYHIRCHCQKENTLHNRRLPWGGERTGGEGWGGKDGGGNKGESCVRGKTTAAHHKEAFRAKESCQTWCF